MSRKNNILLLISSLCILTSCKAKKNFIKVDNSYTLILNEKSILNNGRKIIDTTIKEYDGFDNDKERIITLLNEITDCKYKDKNKIKGIDGGDYSTYSVTFSFSNIKKINFSFDTLDRTYINDYESSTNISFDDSIYKYDCLTNLREKIVNVFNTVNSSYKDITVKEL